MADMTDNAHPRKLRYPVVLELIVLGGMAAVLMIGLTMIRSVVMERARRAQDVRAEIASSWGASQTIGGPLIIVPFRIRTIDSNGRTHFTRSFARFLPDELRVNGELLPERRYRGIYDTVLYRADLKIDGSFSQPDFSRWEVLPEDILWNEAVVTVGISDLRGIRGNALLRWSEQSIPFSGGSADPALWTTGLTAAVPLAASAQNDERYFFSFDLRLNGSEDVGFVPLGGVTIVELRSPWPDPSFAGAFLPESRSVTPAGFAARWSISSLARSYPQRWRNDGSGSSNNQSAIMPSAFRVGLFSPVTGYQKAERSMKYGALFIVLTFLTFFLYELLSPVTLHPVQYFLVGGALCLFYLLLLSISEHSPFGQAYLIASSATVVLITAYAAALLRNRRRTFGLAAVLSFLYGYLYVLLQLEDWALLMGSSGLFVILALVMYATRRIDWGSAHLGKTSEA
jgi:inner membrane protein